MEIPRGVGCATAALKWSTMTEQRRAWLIVGLLFLFMTLNFSDKAIVGLAGFR